ncbi:hypothetical protein BLOT_013980 [Blomia tropicalis]|nr:hypothetical protein BLOT_013980 [Blomia tropicalis]
MALYLYCFLLFLFLFLFLSLPSSLLSSRLIYVLKHQTLKVLCCFKLIRRNGDPEKKVCLCAKFNSVEKWKEGEKKMAINYRIYERIPFRIEKIEIPIRMIIMIQGRNYESVSVSQSKTDRRHQASHVSNCLFHLNGGLQTIICPSIYRIYHFIFFLLLFYHHPPLPSRLRNLNSFDKCRLQSVEILSFGRKLLLSLICDLKTISTWTKTLFPFGQLMCSRHGNFFVLCRAGIAADNIAEFVELIVITNRKQFSNPKVSQ